MAGADLGFDGGDLRAAAVDSYGVPRVDLGLLPVHHAAEPR
jgi:hypothetical protein